jgi:carboxyl-terminal processing protease
MRGLGWVVQDVAGRKAIRRVFAESPAEKAGLRPGDILLEIDRQATRALSPDKVQELLRGMPGTKVSLLIERPAEKRRVTIEVARAELEPPPVPYAAVLPGDIGYIALSQFSRGCSERFRQELIRLKAQAPLKGLIIDLRGNPGGLLQEALEILNLFLPKGELLLETRGRMPESNQKYYAQMHPFEPNLPLVVLIDEQSASASEIVAGTLQDLDRAVILGHRSFGKGLVQVVRPLVENTPDENHRLPVLYAFGAGAFSSGGRAIGFSRPVRAAPYGRPMGLPLTSPCPPPCLSPSKML